MRSTVPASLGRHLRTGYLKGGNSVQELAEKVGIHPRAPLKDVEYFNAPPAEGNDHEFGKGSTAYNRYQGDARMVRTRAWRHPQGPFYAIKLVVGDFGTFAGLTTDEARGCSARRSADPGPLRRRKRHRQHHGRQLSWRGHHARPGLTFGYIAGKHLSGTAP